MSDPTIPKSVINLSDAVHQRSRLAILSVLYELSKADFRLLHQATGLTDGNLGRHIQVLESAGLVTVEKGYSDRKPHTVVEISPEGIRALEAEVEVLKSLVSEVSKEVEVKSVKAKKKPKQRSTTTTDPSRLLRPLEG
jgi:DNA-binding transcriptional ArsR family regulator